MPGIFFTNLWMLAGLTALSVPVLIHLLLRQKRKRLRFSTIQFFLRQDEQSSRRRKLRNWLLLSLRLLICTLLVLAFARPYWQGGAAGAGVAKRQVVVVLDRSLSMQTDGPDGPKWLRAKEAARQILSEPKPSDRAALIGSGVRAEVLSEWAPPAAVNRTLTDLQPTWGATSLGEGLRQASRLVSLSDPSAAVSICVISDLQKSSCTQLASAPIPKEAEIKVLKVGDLVTPNLAVADLTFSPPGGGPSQALIASFSDEDVADLKVDLAIDKQVTSSAAISIHAGAATNLTIALPALKPGWHDVKVQMAGRDSLAADNSRFQSIYVPEPTRVLVVEPRPAKRSFEEESFFVTAALDPAAGLTNGLASRFALEKVSPDELTIRLTSSSDQRRCDLVLLPALRQIPSALGLALASYLRAGGGLLLFVGDGISANRYNAEFRDFLPARLGEVETSRDWESSWRVGAYATNVAVFAPFQKPGSGDLSLGRFSKRLQLSAAAPEAILARFDDGTAFLVASQVGRGRVVLVNTSADTSWSDWPKHKTFVPWLHGTAHYLAELTPSQKTQEQINLIAGADSEIELGQGAAKASFKLQSPQGKEIAVTANDRGQLLDVAVPEPGVYSLRDSAGVEVRRLAVNVPLTECDLTSFSANAFQQQLTRSQEVRPTTLSAGLFGGGGNHRELWHVLLLSALVLLVAEVLLSNRTVI